LKFVRRKLGKFDIAFLDPPYGKGLADSALGLIAGNNILKENGLVVVEHHYKETLLDCYGRLQMSDQRRYGRTGVSFFINKSKK